MLQSIIKNKTSLERKILSFFVVISFSFNVAGPVSLVSAQSLNELNLPAPGTMIGVSPAFEPAIIKGITINPDNPLMFDFLIDVGQTKLDDEAFKTESTKLIKYFLASMTVPEEELWVNLSPYENDRIIPDAFGETEMGRDLLAQDYILKQLTASLLFPEKDLGKAFWDRVYAKAQAQFGTTEIPVNTFNKIWIVPDKAVIYEHNNTAFIVESHLRVMLEEDYVALQKNLGNEHYGLDSMPEGDANDVSKMASEVVREILLPEIEKEVNEGENFGNLRQIYNSMVLSAWYKIALKESLLGQIYVDQNKTAGVDIEDKKAKLKIYDQYLAAFKKGAYDIVHEDYNPAPQDVVYRQYISGGFDGAQIADTVERRTNLATLGEGAKKEIQKFSPDAANLGTGSSRIRDVSAGLAETVNHNLPKVQRFLRDAAVNGKETAPSFGVFSNSGELLEGQRGILTSAPVSSYLSQKQIREPNAQEAPMLNQAFDEAVKQVPSVKGKRIRIVETGNDVGFGVALLQEKNEVVVTSGYLKDVQARGNPNDMMARGIIGASDEVAEFQFLKARHPDYVAKAGTDIEKIREQFERDYYPNNQGPFKGVKGLVELSVDRMIRNAANRPEGETADARRIRINEIKDADYNPARPDDGKANVKVGIIELLRQRPVISLEEELLALRVKAAGFDHVIIVGPDESDQINTSRSGELGLYTYVSSKDGDLAKTILNLARINSRRPGKMNIVRLTQADLDAVRQARGEIQQFSSDSDRVDLSSMLYLQERSDAVTANDVLSEYPDVPIIPEFSRTIPLSEMASSLRAGAASRSVTVPGLAPSVSQAVLDNPKLRGEMIGFPQAVSLLSAHLRDAQEGKPPVLDEDVRGLQPVLDAVDTVKAFRNSDPAEIHQTFYQGKDGENGFVTVKQVAQVFNFIQRADLKVLEETSNEFVIGSETFTAQDLNPLLKGAERLAADSPSTAKKLTRYLNGEPVSFTSVDRVKLERAKILDQEGVASQKQALALSFMLQPVAAAGNVLKPFRLTLPKPNILGQNAIKKLPRPIDLRDVKRVDPAQANSKTYGGINLNPELLDLQIKRDGDGVPLPLNEQPIENMNIDGFLPYIIQITPVTNLQLLLGINSPADGSNQLSFHQTQN